MTSERRYDLDWLRVIAFVVLIYFHAAIFFIPGGLPLIQNAETSVGLQLFVDISSQFRLGLLFMISGAGVAFARNRRTTQQFIVERSQRLLLPLTFGMVCLIPPMVYFEKVFLGEVELSFYEFIGSEYFNQGLYPAGHLSWHHLWFLVYLYLFCLLAIRIYPWLDRQEGRLHEELTNIGRKPYGLFGFILVLLIPELILRPIFPGFRDLISDWASFSHWFLLFLAGYTFARNRFLLGVAEKLRYISSGVAVIALALMYWFFGSPNFEVPMSDDWLIEKFLFWCSTRMTFVWAILLCCFGFAARYLRFGGPWLAYLNEAVYPLFLLHLPILVICGSEIVERPWLLSTKFLLLTTVTVVLCLAIYSLVIKPFNPMRKIFCVKKKEGGR